MLSKALDTFGQLELPQDGEWIHLVLSYLKAWVEQSGEMLMYGRNRTDYVRELVSSLKVSLDRLETGMATYLTKSNIYLIITFLKDLLHPEHPALTIKISHTAKLANTRDGSYFDVYVTNKLPCVSSDINVFDRSINDPEQGIPNRRNCPYCYGKGHRTIPFCYQPNGRMSSWEINIHRLLPGKSKPLPVVSESQCSIRHRHPACLISSRARCGPPSLCYKHIIAKVVKVQTAHHHLLHWCGYLTTRWRLMSGYHSPIKVSIFILWKPP